jgi:hypothetical protein
MQTTPGLPYLLFHRYTVQKGGRRPAKYKGLYAAGVLEFPDTEIPEY